MNLLTRVIPSCPGGSKLPKDPAIECSLTVPLRAVSSDRIGPYRRGGDSREQGTMASVTHGSTRNLRRADLVSARDTCCVITLHALNREMSPRLARPMLL